MPDDEIIERLFSIRGKTALVTGGSRGIGEMIARALVAAGVKTYICSRKAVDCAATAAALGRHGRCIALPFNLSTVDAVRALSAELATREKKLDILVNNAGAIWAAPLDEYSDQGWDNVVDLNLKSPFFLIQAFLPLLKAAAQPGDPARVINIASINGLTNPHAPTYAYSAAKAAMIHLTRHLAADLAAQNINVNSVAPGYFMTRMMAHADEAEIVPLIPHRRTGKADDAGGAAIFLASRASAYMTGNTLTVDGGLVASA